MEQDWVFDGGRPCLDLVNTMRDRLLGGRELLTSQRAVADWLVAAGLASRRPKISAVEHARFVALRDAIDDVLIAVSASRPPSPASVRLLNRTAASARGPVPRLRVDVDGVPTVAMRHFDDPVLATLAMLAADAIELAGSATLVRVCAAHDCGLRFVDLSPKRSRQWCSMARCGNRAKARAHYAKARAGQSAR